MNEINETSYEDYLEKTHHDGIDSHAITIIDWDECRAWGVIGCDRNDTEWLAMTPFSGSSQEVKDMLRRDVGLDDDISGPAFSERR